MGCDIHIVAQRRRADDSWEDLDFVPFDWRSYAVFGFLADVRNYSAVLPISQPRGLPDDLSTDENGDCPERDLGDHSFSWLSVSELLAYDYAATVEDRRCTRQVAPGSWDGGQTCEPGEGVRRTWAEFLGPNFMRDLAELQRLGADRIVFGFDS